MKVESFEEEIKQINKLTIIELKRSVFVDGFFGQFFVEKAEFLKAKKKETSPFEVFRKYPLKKYHLASKKLLEILSTVGVYGSEIFDNLPECSPKILPPYKELKSINENDLLCFYSPSHLFFRLGKKTPLSIAYYTNYIGGIGNDNFDLKKAMTILKRFEKKGWVLNPEIQEVPYYNQTDDRTHGIKFFVKLPQDLHDSLWLKAKKRKKRFENNEYEPQIKDMLVPRYWSKSHPDPLGLKAALLPKEENE